MTSFPLAVVQSGQDEGAPSTRAVSNCAAERPPRRCRESLEKIARGVWPLRSQVARLILGSASISLPKQRWPVLQLLPEAREGPRPPHFTIPALPGRGRGLRPVRAQTETSSWACATSAGHRVSAWWSTRTMSSIRTKIEASRLRRAIRDYASRPYQNRIKTSPTAALGNVAKRRADSPSYWKA